MEKVRVGVMVGRTPKVAVPIKPREEEMRASGEMGKPREMRSGERFGQKSAILPHILARPTTPQTYI